MDPSQTPGGDRRPQTFFGHPRGLSTLFFTEMWERFSYYGMRALLVLFMIDSARGGMGMGKAEAGAIYGLYTFGVYALALPGGWVADRLIGQRRAVLVGGIIIAAGHYALAIPAEVTFYVGLALVALGTGLLKPTSAPSSETSIRETTLGGTPVSPFSTWESTSEPSWGRGSARSWARRWIGIWVSAPPAWA